MQVCGNFNQIASSLSQLCLEPRETGLIDIVNMKWNSSQVAKVQEFKSIYNSRLQQLQRMLPHPNITPISQIAEKKKEYTVRGVMKRLQFNRIRAFQKKFQQKYNTDQKIYDRLDALEIEDKSGKIKFIINKETVHNIPNCHPFQDTDLPYGVCMLLTGHFVKHSNQLVARQIVLPTIPPQPAYQPNFVNSEGVAFKDKKIIVASEPTPETLQRIKAFINHFSKESLNICALVIIGGIKMKTEEILQMGRFIDEVKDSIDLFIMPSSGDERHKLFPLKPYSGLFFVKSQLEIGLCSNPQLFEAQNGFNIHISCGENVKDLIKNCSLPKNDLEAMQLMLRFNHYCPTSPFSLKTQPYAEDMLVVDQLPHVMISGKGSNFQARVADFANSREVLLISIPEERMALVGLNGLYCKELL